jgi:hypothetical protein
VFEDGVRGAAHHGFAQEARCATVGPERGFSRAGVSRPSLRHAWRTMQHSAPF